MHHQHSLIQVLHPLPVPVDWNLRFQKILNKNKCFLMNSSFMSETWEWILRKITFEVGLVSTERSCMLTCIEMDAFVTLFFSRRNAWKKFYNLDLSPFKNKHCTWREKERDLNIRLERKNNNKNCKSSNNHALVYCWNCMTSQLKECYFIFQLTNQYTL